LIESVVRVDPLRVDLASLLLERHVALVSDDELTRKRASDAASMLLSGQLDSQLIRLDGQNISDLRSLRLSIDRALPGDDGRPMLAPIDGPRGLLSRLRELPHIRMDGHHIKNRWFLWTDADKLLQASPSSFSVAIDAFTGIAAESEYASEDLLLISRVILIGDLTLARCAADDRGPLRSWRPGSPWSKATGLLAPAFSVQPL
jgi:hypothetical protein